jgi:GntR family transcriptional regulator / MocR family aminotransferase
MKEPNLANFIEPSFQLNIVLPQPGSNALLSSLYGQLRSAISDGRLAAGVRLPPTRTLSVSLGVSRNTVIAAYEMLRSEGYLSALAGAGTRVASALPSSSRGSATVRQVDLSAIANRRFQPAWRGQRAAFVAGQTSPPRLDFRIGVPDQSYLPFDVWNRLSSRVVRQLAKLSIGYSNAEGSSLLRAAIAGHVSATRAVACEAQDVLVTSGAQQAFDLLARVLVTPGQTVVAVENPGYPPLRDAFAAYGAKVVPIPVDNEGIVVDRLPANTRVICVTPSHQFPTGVVMSARRRVALLAFATAHEACIVEDDYDSEFRFGGRPLDALQTLDRAGQVFYIGTFSKSLFPALRIGFIVMPPWARQTLAEVKRLADWYTPIHAQETLAAFIAEGHFGRHARKMQRVYAQRREVLLEALQDYCGDTLVPMVSSAGLHLSVRLSAPRKIEPLLERATQLGLGLESLQRYSLDNSVEAGFALGYSSIEAQNIRKGIRTLGQMMG